MANDPNAPSYLGAHAFGPPRRTFSHQFRRTAALHRDRPALSDSTGDVSYHDLAEAVEGTVNFLWSQGVRRGDRVVVVLPNSALFVTLFLAAADLGVVLVPVPPEYRHRELLHILQESEPRAVVAIDQWRGFDIAGVIADACEPDVFLTLVRSDDRLAVDALITDTHRSREVVQLLPSWEGDQPFLLQYTSGTTGNPKGCVHSQNTLCRPALAILDRVDITADDRLLVAAGFTHLLGIVDGIMLAAMTGASIRPLHHPSQSELVEAMRQWKPTIVTGVPAHAHSLQTADLDEQSIRPWRYFFTAGTRLPATQQSWLNDIARVTVVNQYGLTEISNCFDAICGPGQTTPEASVGTASGGVEAKIVDRDGLIVPRGQEGEIYLRADWSFLGYWRADDKLGEIRDASGWIKTGDIGFLDSQDRLHLHGRIKHTINRGGIKLYPEELESCLLELATVQEVAVCGVADERLGQRTVALVVPAGSTPVTVETIRQALSGEIAWHKLPDAVVSVTSIPRTSNGKIRRASLVEVATAALSDSNRSSALQREEKA